ncbi:molybdopterin molybdotransferase MoeA [Iodobacter sp. CM08]|uniref:molybdopterin molybdotransferase MoeA n=1 Tax=Iodobacter sp. CM08 TaxID=3085902 RepID=UPI00298179B8|nr:gephyrin-like molybdotransferase Glp [Iodobacter sp. CM08]MDW5415393.1 molybdopterin molybdotransferase MoeA [Iodobacter sp. CM08]
MLDFDTALSRLIQAARVSSLVEVLPLSQANGRVLSQNVVSQMAVPGFDNSAMDGYALHIGDAWPDSFKLVQRIAAGEVGHALNVGEAARIFTGAPIPAGANGVVMQENCRAEDGQIYIAQPVELGSNIRLRGEDIEVGSVILPAGTRLSPAAIGLAASIGVAELTVKQRLRVALLSTGDELVEPGQLLAAGQIYNSNRYALTALLEDCLITDLGIVPDDAELTRDILQTAAKQHDVLITSGGVSVGEEDHVKGAVEQLGRLELWKIAIKPGKPFAYGRIGDCDFIGLPGNPVSSLVTFLLLVRPFLLARLACLKLEPARFKLMAAFDWKKAGNRREFLRGRLNNDGQVEIYPQQGSGVLTSLVWGDGLVDIAVGETIKLGDSVQFIPLHSMR